MSERIPLSRDEATTLLFVLDDADRLFMHHRGEQLLDLWRRLHLACCYRDGDQGYYGTAAERDLSLSTEEAIAVWLTCDPEWIRTLRNPERGRMRQIVNKLRSRGAPSEAETP